MRVLMGGGGGVTCVCPKQHGLKHKSVHFTGRVFREHRHDTVVNSDFCGFTAVCKSAVLCVRVLFTAGDDEHGCRGLTDRQLPAAYKQALWGKPIWGLK